jgi:hypothetical protein
VGRVLPELHWRWRPAMFARNPLFPGRDTRPGVTARLVRGGFRLFGPSADIHRHGEWCIRRQGMAACRLFPEPDLLLATGDLLVVGFRFRIGHGCGVLQWQRTVLQFRSVLAQLVLLWRAGQGKQGLPLMSDPYRNLLGATILCVGLLAGCAHGSAGASATCKADIDCDVGFCDRGGCAEREGVFGAACTPAPRTAEGVRDGKLHSCGAYLCIDSRCRSCQSDSQCQAELGAPRCLASPGRPGFRCGR